MTHSRASLMKLRSLAIKVRKSVVPHRGTIIPSHTQNSFYPACHARIGTSRKGRDSPVGQYNSWMIVNRICISFPVLRLADCEKDIRATTCGNHRRQRDQKRVRICFTNGMYTARAGRAAINANVILWRDQMIFRCHERHRRTISFVLPRCPETNKSFNSYNSQQLLLCCLWRAFRKKQLRLFQYNGLHGLLFTNVLPSVPLRKRFVQSSNDTSAISIA